VYPHGDAVRDRAHLRLIARLRARLHPGLSWRAEVPVPIAGDPRSGDGVIGWRFGSALVEAETHLGDIQALERRVRPKPATWVSIASSSSSPTPRTVARSCRLIRSWAKSSPSTLGRA
jgi:hypothetical protein